MLIALLRIPIPAAVLILPILDQLCVQLGDDLCRSHTARIIDDANVRTDPNGVPSVVRAELTWHSPYQEPEALQLVRAGCFDGPCHEFVAPFVAPRNASGV